MLIENKNRKLPRPHISNTDDIAFKYNNDVLYACFNDDYKSEFGQYAVKDTHDGNCAWFPKERMLKNGVWVAGSKEVNWKNYIDEDSIVQYLNPGESEKGDRQPEYRTDYCPMYTFWQSADDNLFRFVGVYIRDVNASSIRHVIYRKLADELDLTNWHNNADFEYESNDKYLKRFQKERKTIKNAYESFDKKVLLVQEKNLYDKFEQIKDNLNLNPSFNAELAAEVLSGSICFNQKEKEEFFEKVKSCTSDQFGGALIELMFEDRTEHNHNDLIRNSPLGEKYASRVLALSSSDYYIYYLSEDETTYFLKKLKIPFSEHADSTEKHCLLYFWRQCNLPKESPYVCVETLRAAFPRKKVESVTALMDSASEYQVGLAMKWFEGYVVEKQDSSSVDFNAGEIKKREGYKKDLIVSANKALESKEWTPDMIGTGMIFECATKAMNDKNNNIVDYHNISHFEEVGRNNIARAEQILFDVFCGKDDGTAFENACAFWGRRYDILSYLMFLKDGTRYVPVKSSNHKEIFEKLKINTSCFSECTWENYKLFLDALNEIKSHLELYYGTEVDLIDTHSFVWMMSEAPEDFSCKWITDNKEAAEHLIDGDDPLESTVVCGKEEGKKVAYYTTKYERNPKNRREAIRLHGYNCAACGFNFEEQYGELGKEFIEVHHVKPLYSLNETVTVNPKTDLVCLCANCHRMVHKKRGTVLTVEELKRIISKTE